MPEISVGVDGSGHSERALEWAVKEAAIRHAPLTVLAVHPVAAGHWTGNPVTYPEADEPETEQTRKAAQEVTQKMIDQVGAPGPASVTVRAVSGLPAKELINASADADLVVVGARGGGGFPKLVLGSVSGQVVHHAACPVVVVRGDR
jgi:nucleotide-binding universal stress UspA family protein